MTRYDPHHVNAQITVSIVDDDENDRLLAERALNRSKEFRCVGAHSSAADALEAIPQTNPFVVLMDIHMPGMCGIECTRRLKTMLPQLKIIMLSGMTDSDWMTKAARAGADGYLNKPLCAAQCLAWIMFTERSAVLPLGLVNLSTASNSRGSAANYPGHALLNPRESAIADFVSAGLRNKEIADQLHTSEDVVGKLLKRIFLKLRATNRAEVASRWTQERIRMLEVSVLIR